MKKASEQLSDIEIKLLHYFNDNLNPSDDDFHGWAEEQGIDVHEAEAGAYSLASRLAKFMLTDGKSNEEGFKLDDADKKEVKLGLEIESEHSSDPVIQTKITLDHLAEFPNYNSELIKWEKGMEGESKLEAAMRKSKKVFGK
jgi:hypothetical protein